MSTIPTCAQVSYTEQEGGFRCQLYTLEIVTRTQGTPAASHANYLALYTNASQPHSERTHTHTHTPLFHKLNFIVTLIFRNKLIYVLFPLKYAKYIL